MRKYEECRRGGYEVEEENIKKIARGKIEVRETSNTG